VAETLSIRIKEDGSRFVDRNIEKIGETAKKTGSFVNLLLKALAALGGALSVRQVLNYAKAWVDVTNSLRVATDTTEQLVKAQEDVFRIAQSARAPLRQTAILYSRLTGSAKELNASQADISKTVELTTKSLAIQGSSAAEAGGALLQFSQLLGGTVVQAQEFNSLLDGARPLLQAVAAGLEEAGGNVNTLRQLVREGKVSSEAFFRALLAGSAIIDNKFGKSVVTIDQSLVLLDNSLTKAIGKLDETFGVTAALASQIQDLATEIDSGVIQARFEATITLWASSFEDVTDAASEFENEIEFLADVVGRSVDFISDAFTNLPDNIITSVKVITVETAALFDRVSIKFNAFFDELKKRRQEFKPGDAGFDIAETTRLAGEASKAQIDASNDARTSVIDDILNQRQVRLDTFNQTIDQINQERDLIKALSEERKMLREEESSETKKVKLTDFRGSSNELTKVNKELERQAELLKLSTRERQIETDVLKIQDALRKKGIQLSTEERMNIENQLVGIQALRDSQNQELLRGTAEFNDLLVQQERDKLAQIDALRQQDLISEQTAQQLRARVAAESNEQRFKNAQAIAGQLATLATSENKKLAALGKAAAITQATIDGVLAVQKALSSLPPPASFAVAAAVGAAAAANVASIATARQLGGDLNSGQISRVGEGDRPEMFTGQSGQQFFIPPERGRIEPLSASTAARGGAGGAPINNIEVNPPKNDVRIVNVTDPSIVGDFISTPTGEAAIINVIEKNPGIVSRLARS